MVLQGPLWVLLRTSMTYLSPFLSQLGSSKRIRDCFLRSQYVLDNGYQTCTVGLVVFCKICFYFTLFFQIQGSRYNFNYQIYWYFLWLKIFKVNSVQVACAKCFSVHIIKCHRDLEARYMKLEKKKSLGQICPCHSNRLSKRSLC